MTIQINGTSGISGVDGSAATPALQGSDSNTGISFGTDEVNINTGGTTRATVDSSGRVLVGTSSDSQISTVVLQGRSDDATQNAVLRLCRGSTPTTTQALGSLVFGGSGHESAAGINAFRDSGTWTSGSSHPSALVFNTTADGASSQTERMRISNDGVTTLTSPSLDNYTLTVQSSGSSNYQRGLLLTFPSRSPNDASSVFWAAIDTTAVRGAFYSNGGLYNYQANDANLCDEREKKNIENLESTWGCLKNWDLKKFHYNEDADTDDKHYGVIAQQVASHCPEVITDWVKQKAEDAVLDEDGNIVTPAKEEIVRMGVKEQQMMWMAIKALQEAQTRIETLETRLTALEGGTNP